MHVVKRMAAVTGAEGERLCYTETFFGLSFVNEANIWHVMTFPVAIRDVIYVAVYYVPKSQYRRTARKGSEESTSIYELKMDFMHGDASRSLLIWTSILPPLVVFSL
jgi:hypothetical protein